MRPSHHSTATPLLALVNATAEWHAGLPGSCSASVRLLDRVHFTVYRGDCVVVHHDDPASARVLLAALGGHDALPVHRRLRGQRHCAPGVRIRRCSMPVAAVAALQAGWQQLADHGDAAPDARASSDATVHLLRASRHGSLTAYEREQWSGWALRARERGGALVIVSPGVLRPARAPDVLPRLVAAAGSTTARASVSAGAVATAGTLREQAGEAYATIGSTARPHALWLHHGRLFNLRSWE